MSTRSRWARQCARTCIRGVDGKVPIDPEEFRSWVRSVQRYWGRPREMRKNRRAGPHTAAGRVRSARRWHEKMDRLLPKPSPAAEKDRP